jgi:tetratricopeptide (TPR) repeat protein
MILRLSSPVARGLLVLAALGIALVLSWFSIRNARAAHFVGMETLQGFERATQLEPGNPRNWYLLGRYWQYNLENPDTRQAIRAYQMALSLDPRSADSWLDLATAFESEGNLSAARDAYVRAKRAYPLSAEVSWRYGNFLLRQNDLQPAFAEIRRAVLADPKRGAEAFSRCMHVDPDLEFVLNRVLPPSREVYVDIIHDLTSTQQIDQALKVWSRLAVLQPKLQLSDASPLLDGLIAQRRLAEAHVVWEEALKFSGIPAPSDPPGSLVWDGGFESGIVGTGFAWRYPPQSGSVQIALDPEVKHSGNYSLRLMFDGKHNVNFSDVCQIVPVQPSADYVFSAWVRTRALTTDQGIRFVLTSAGDSGNSSVWTSDVQGTQSWIRIERPWTASKDVRELQICASRGISQNLDNAIAGTAWIDDVALFPQSTESRKP